MPFGYAVVLTAHPEPRELQRATMVLSTTASVTDEEPLDCKSSSVVVVLLPLVVVFASAVVVVLLPLVVVFASTGEGLLNSGACMLFLSMSYF